MRLKVKSKLSMTCLFFYSAAFHLFSGMFSMPVEHNEIKEHLEKTASIYRALKSAASSEQWETHATERLVRLAHESELFFSQRFTSLYETLWQGIAQGIGVGGGSSSIVSRNILKNAALSCKTVHQALIKSSVLLVFGEHMRMGNQQDFSFKATMALIDDALYVVKSLLPSFKKNIPLKNIQGVEQEEPILKKRHSLALLLLVGFGFSFAISVSWLGYQGLKALNGKLEEERTQSKHAQEDRQGIKAEQARIEATFVESAQKQETFSKEQARINATVAHTFAGIQQKQGALGEEQEKMARIVSQQSDKAVTMQKKVNSVDKRLNDIQTKTNEKTDTLLKRIESLEQSILARDKILQELKQQALDQDKRISDVKNQGEKADKELLKKLHNERQERLQAFEKERAARQSALDAMKKSLESSFETYKRETLLKGAEQQSMNADRIGSLEAHIRDLGAEVQAAEALKKTMYERIAILEKNQAAAASASAPSTGAKPQEWSEILNKGLNIFEKAFDIGSRAYDRYCERQDRQRADKAAKDVYADYLRCSMPQVPPHKPGMAPPRKSASTRNAR